MKVIFALLCFIAVCFATTYSSCGTGSLTLSSLTLTPDPPKAGANLTIHVTGSLASALSGGNAWMNVSLQYQGWHPVPGSPFEFPVCDSGECPIAAGSFDYEGTVAVPIFTPPGTYAGTLVVTDQNNAPVACLNWQTTISPA